MKRILCLLVPYALLAVILTALFLIGASLVGASPEESGVWVFEVDDKVVKGNEGDVIPVATFDTPSQIIGQSCLVTVVGDNVGLPSPHPNNDIVMTSDTSSVEVKDFERHEYQETEATGRLTLGATLDASIRLGPDKKSSGGATIRLHDCRFYAYLPIVNGPALPRGNVVYNTTSYCTEEDFVQGFAWAKNTSDVYYVDVEVQFSGWGIASARLLPGEEHTFQIEPGLASIPAGIVYISLTWENGDVESFEVPFEALDCTPEWADWNYSVCIKDPVCWGGTQFAELVPVWWTNLFWEIPEWAQHTDWPNGRQVGLNVDGHTVEIDLEPIGEEQYVQTVWVDGDVVDVKENGDVVEYNFGNVVILVGQGCDDYECQELTVFWRMNLPATGLLVDVAHE